MATLAKAVEAAEAGEPTEWVKWKAKGGSTACNNPLADDGPTLDATRGAAEAGNLEQQKSRSSIPYYVAPNSNFSQQKGLRQIRKVPTSPLKKLNLRPDQRFKDAELPGQTERLAMTRQLLEETKDTKPEDVSTAHRELAVRLCYSHLADGSVNTALDVFKWLETHNQVDAALWAAVLECLSKARMFTRQGDIYLRHAFPLPDNLVRGLIRGLIASYRLGAAKDLLNAKLSNDRGCVWSWTYLHYLHKRTHNDGLVETQFRKLLKSLLSLDMPLHSMMFVPVLKSMVFGGRLEDAEALLKEMESEYGFPIGAHHLGQIAIGKALISDWPAVDMIFQQIHEFEPSPENRNGFQRAFDRVFLEFYLAHSGEEIRKFIFRAVDKFGLMPEQVIFEHMMLAYIQKGEARMLEELILTAQERSWDVKFDLAYCLDALRNNMLTCQKPLTVGLWETFRRAQIGSSKLPPATRILGAAKNSFPMLAAYKLPRTGEETTWSRKAANIPDYTMPIDNFTSLRRRMIQCLHSGKAHAAVSLYETAKGSGRTVKQVHVKLAAIASMLYDRSLETAKAIFEAERENFADYDRSVRSILGEDDPKSKSERLQMALFGFYDILGWEKLPTNHGMLVSIAARLIHHHRDSRTALLLFRSVNKSIHYERAPWVFEVAVLRLIARACRDTGNLEGLRWVAMVALKYQPQSSEDLVYELRKAVRHLRATQDSPSLKKRESRLGVQLRYLDFLTESLYRATKLQYRTSVLQDPPIDPSIGVVREKLPRVPRYTSGPKDTVVEKTLDEMSFKDPLSQPLSREFLEQWDERVELEKALRPEEENPWEIKEAENKQNEEDPDVIWKTFIPEDASISKAKDLLGA
jgi:hypothetical protein